MKAVIARTTQQKVKVNNTNGVLQTQTPITLKNQVTEISSLEDIADVAEVDVSTGSTLVYNASTDKYEVKKLDVGSISGEFDLDGGEF